VLVADDKVSIEISVDGNAEVKVNKIASAVEDFEKRSTKSLGNFNSAFETFKGVVAGELVVHAFEKMADAAVEFFRELVVEGIKSAEEYEVSLNRLNVALASNGNFSKAASKSFEEYASHIQNTTKYNDDAVLSSAALLETLTKLDVEGLKKAETGVINLAAALNIDLDSAASLVAKAIEGNVGALGRYGIRVKEGATQAETLANVMEKLGNLAGTAEGQVNTFAGATARLAHAQDDSRKNLGFIITQNQAVVNVISALTDIVNENTEAGAKNSQTYKEFVAQSLIVAADAAAAFVVGLDAIASLGKIAFYGLEGAINAVSLGIITLIDGPFALLYKGLSLLPGIGDEFAKRFDAILENAAGVAATINKDANGIEDALNGPSDTAKKFSENLLTLREAATSGLAAIKSGAEAGVEPLNQAKDATNELTKAQLDLIEAGKKVAERLTGEDPSKKYEKDLEALSAYFVSKKQLTDEDAALFDQLEADRDAKLTEKRQKEITDLVAKNDALKALNRDLFADEIAANEEKIREIADAEGKGSRLSLQNEKRLAEDKKKTQLATAQVATDILGNAAAAAKAFGEEGFAAWKAISIAQATVATYTSAVKAYDAALELGPPGLVLAPIAAAAAVAAGIANVATISATHYAQGIDSVPAGFERDNFPAYLQSGERVVPRESNKKLTAMLDGEGPMIQILQEIRGLLASQPGAQVYLDGREIFNSLRSQLQSGRSFA